MVCYFTLKLPSPAPVSYTTPNHLTQALFRCHDPSHDPKREHGPAVGQPITGRKGRRTRIAWGDQSVRSRCPGVNGTRDTAVHKPQRLSRVDRAVGTPGQGEPILGNHPV
jgi:hypothetical protein